MVVNDFRWIPKLCWKRWISERDPNNEINIIKSFDFETDVAEF